MAATNFESILADNSTSPYASVLSQQDMQGGFTSLWGMANDQYELNYSPMRDGFFDNVGAGIDLGQALLYRGGQSIAEVMGIDDSSFGQAMVEGKEDNLREVAKVAADPMFDEEGSFSFAGLGDQLARGIGTVATILPSAGVGLVAGAVGAPATATTLIAGGGLSALMNIGDIGLKAEEFDKEYVASMGDIGTGLALGALEPIAASKFLKAISPAARSASPELLAAIRAGKSDEVAAGLRAALGSGTSFARATGSAALTSGLTEGVQDLTTTLKATQSTDYWDELDVERSLKESAAEALIGGLLGIPFGAGSTVITKLQEKSDMHVADMIEDGRMYYDKNAGGRGIGGYVVDQEKISVAEQGTVGHLFSKYIKPIIGASGSKAAAQINTPAMQQLLAKFNQARGDLGRRMGITPVHFEAMSYKADFMRQVERFRDLSEVEAKRVHDVRVTGQGRENLTAREEKGLLALNELLDTKMKKEWKAIGFDFKGIEGNTYFPLFGRLDYKKIEQSQEEFINSAMETAERLNVPLERDKVEKYVRRIRDQGFEHMGEGVSGRLLRKAEEEYVRLVEEEGMAADAALKQALDGLTGRIGKGKGDKGARINTSNALETHRFLAELPQDFWNSWTKPDVSVKDSIMDYVDMLSERMAHAKVFGKDNELFYAELAGVLNDARSKGINFNAETVINDLSNLMNTSQRIPIRNLDVSQGKALRQAQNAIKGGLNVVMLPLSLLSSLAETFTVLERTGGNVATAIPKSLQLTAKIIKEQFKQGRGLSFKDAKYLVENTEIIDDLGISLYELKNTAAARLADNEIGGKVTNIENFFFNMTGTPQWTEALRIQAAVAAERMFIADANAYIKAAAEGNLKEQIRLSNKFGEAGIQVNEVANWVKRGAKRDKFYFDKFRMGVLNVVEDTVMRPRMSQKPAWMSDERFKLLGQLKSYAIVFTNVVMKGWYNQMISLGTPEDKIRQAANIAPYIALMLATQVMSAALREFAKTGDIERWEDKEALQHLTAAIAYLGGLSFVVDPLNASGYGVDPTTIFLGPAASKANDVINGLGGLLNGSIGVDDAMGKILRDVTRGFPGLSGLVEEALK